MAKKTNEEWIKSFKEVHGDRYDYSETDCDNRDEKGKVKVICPKHGEFWIKPINHKRGQGCKHCYYERNMATNEKFIRKAQIKHNFKYIYTKTEYKDPYTNVCITCPKHGDFWQTPSNHLMGCGCKECMKEKFSLSQDLFIDRIQSIFGDKYDLSKVNYQNENNEVCLICKTHGEFYKKPRNLYRGYGCRKCGMSKLENEVATFLDNKNIKYLYQCSSKEYEWLGLQSLDFYLPKYNVAIECQGIQHFKNCSNIFNDEKLKRTIESDERKRVKCKTHNIRLLYYSNLGIEYPYKVFEDKEELLKEIIKGEN